MRHPIMRSTCCWTILVLLWSSVTRHFQCLKLEKFVLGKCLALSDDVIKYHVPYHVCTDLCRDRADCRAISFWTKLSMCRMNTADTGTVSSDQAACMFSKKADWNQKSSGCGADSCPDGMGCREQCGEDICYDQGCAFPPAITNGEVFGSGTSNGSTLMYRCDAGYLLWGNATITCGPDGWDGDQPICLQYLVDGPNGVSDDKLSASSVLDSHLIGDTSYFSPKYARLNTKNNGTDGTGAWSALDLDTNQYIQVKFDNTKDVYAVALQGRDNDVEDWVTSFKVEISTSCQQFTAILDDAGAEKIFDGNTDKNTVVIRFLPEPKNARCLRIIPMTWHGHISLRFDVLGM